jgi:mono/diheme cytochrome c family protein
MAPFVGFAAQGQNPLPGAKQPASNVVVVQPGEEKGLEVDALIKEYTAKPGEESHTFTFAVKNISKAEIVINQVRTSCGCTVAKLPSQPWKLAPGEGGDILLTIDLKGKTGTLIKTATIDTATAGKVLTFKVDLPAATAAAAMDRDRNQQLAAKNRQAVFQGDCARCHVTPSVGQQGVGLYVTACTICHEAEHRATMVPDLHALKGPTDRQYWKTMISQGKAGTLMPAFAQDQGGPLTSAQIESLVDYLVGDFAGKQAAKSGK